MATTNIQCVFIIIMNIKRSGHDIHLNKYSFKPSKTGVLNERYLVKFNRLIDEYVNEYHVCCD